MDIRLSALHPAQQMVVDSRARFRVLACGRRFGKTTVAIDLMANMLLDGKRAAYFAPTYRMGAEAWRMLLELLRPVVRSAREDDWRLELRTGGVFEGWSLAQGAGETVRGRQYDFVVMDEAALLESAAVWHGAIRPLLTDTLGGALFCSTPRGRGWFWQLFHQGQNPDFPEWASWQFPTSANPLIQASEIEAARRDMPERVFQQEYLATFLDDGGAVFRNVEAVCNLPHPLAPSPLHGEGEIYSGEGCFFGVDWGKDSDFTCISAMTRSGQQIWLERFNQIGWEMQRGRLTALYERFRPNIILAEENSMGSVNIEALQSEGLPVRGFTTTSKSKAPLIDQLALAMERGEVQLLNDPVLKHELMSYGVSKTAQGWRYGAPSGGHDDTVMATALSLWATRRYGSLDISFV